MRLPILVLAHIATARRPGLYRTTTTGEGSNTSSIAATALQNFTAAVGSHGSDRGVLSRVDLGIPRRLMQRLALILAASNVVGGPRRAVEAKAMPTAFVAPGVRRNALSGSGFGLNAMEAAGPGSGIPDPSGRDMFSFMDEVENGTTADLKNPLKGLDTDKFLYQSYLEDADQILSKNVDAVPHTMIEEADVWLKKMMSEKDMSEKDMLKMMMARLFKEGTSASLLPGRSDAEAAAAGMTKFKTNAAFLVKNMQARVLDDAATETLNSIQQWTTDDHIDIPTETLNSIQQWMKRESSMKPGNGHSNEAAAAEEEATVDAKDAD